MQLATEFLSLRPLVRPPEAQSTHRLTSHPDGRLGLLRRKPVQAIAAPISAAVANFEALRARA